MPQAVSIAHLNGLYDRFNRREFVSPDPLEFLYRYDDPRDREIVGLIASFLAYGRVGQILESVRAVLRRLDPGPARHVARSTRQSLRRAFACFRHRFTTGEEVALTLFGAKCVIERFGSLQACFEAGMGRNDATVLPALTFLVEELNRGFRGRRNTLLPSPRAGSACKRLLLFLRWMIRHDEVDPGVWTGIPTCRLLVPLDTHMHRMCRALGFTTRKQATLRTAVEVTAVFREIAPCDPARYDFPLTRLGIRDDIDCVDLLQSLHARPENGAHGRGGQAPATRPWVRRVCGARERFACDRPNRSPDVPLGTGPACTEVA